ncbi:MAG: sulfotransferase [Bacteroidales bacterium]|nr:sulfotransferase [Bacteroidales bacterium]
MTKLIYIISPGHSGSTLADCILGTHPDFISSGELRYLGWQIERTKDVKPTVEAQNACTCAKDFRECEYWSEVFERLRSKTGIDMRNDPLLFNMYYFRQFSYQDRGSLKPALPGKIKARLTRKWIQAGHSYKKLIWMEPKLGLWIKNNWLLYETMAEVASKPIVVDSSKHLTIALLLQQYRPNDVTILFLNRSPEGLAASHRKWAVKSGKNFHLQDFIEMHKKHHSRLTQCKNSIDNLKYIDIQYEEMVKHPATFLHTCVAQTGANEVFKRQTDEEFYIDPSKLHLVAGNPMRYRGRQLIKNDERWKTELTDKEKEYIATKYYKTMDKRWL